MERLVALLNIVPWLGLVGFIVWIFGRIRKASRLERENKLLRVLKEVSDEEKRIDDSNLSELVDEFNKRSGGSKEG